MIFFPCFLLFLLFPGDHSPQVYRDILYAFLQLYHIPLCECAVVYSTSPILIDILVVFSLLLLQIVLYLIPGMSVFFLNFATL